jgi:hypothetical protein
MITHFQVITSLETDCGFALTALTKFVCRRKIHLKRTCLTCGHEDKKSSLLCQGEILTENGIYYVKDGEYQIDLEG